MLKDKLDLSGKRALVTGASSGIGAEVARELGACGASVALNGRDERRLTDVVADIERAGGRAVAVSGDLAADDGPAAVADATARELGGIDILVPSAGIFEPQPFDETSADALDRVWAINVRAPFRLLQSALPRLEDGGGVVVFISSISGHVGFANDSAYAATKAAIDGLARALSVELGPRGVRVNAIAPGFTETPMNEGFREDRAMVDRAVACTPAGRLGRPADIAAAVAFLASDGAEYIHGIMLPVDGNYPTSAIQLGLA
jgi:NAD(P)-dependent dehydrogenase (short-subunit alcohol dehydrogenase family)